MNKTYRIKSRVRFTTFILILLFAITGLFNTVMGSYDAAGAESQDYITIEIVAGDTLWDIANKYKKQDTDTRQAVHIIKNINDISNDIEPGMLIKVPVYNED